MAKIEIFRFLRNLSMTANIPSLRGFRRKSWQSTKQSNDNRLLRFYFVNSRNDKTCPLALVLNEWGQKAKYSANE